jgi:hypothetical protein
MIMKTEKQRTQIFMVLVPHRDTRLTLRKYSDALFKAGFAGAYQFPWVAPLAVLSRPLTSDELKNFARSIRESTGGGKIIADEWTRTAFLPGGETTLFGLRLDLSLAKDTPGSQKIIEFFSPPVIGACLLSAGDATAPPPPPALSFRAAAVANMFWRPLHAGGEKPDAIIGYKWKIGNLRWLAAARKKA